MKLLAINTAFKKANIALFDGENKRYQTIDSNCKHAEVVLKTIDDILDNDKIKDIDTIAVIVGPGSFTGVRIGVALAKGFMVANPNLKAISINSLDFMSYIYQKQNPQSEYYCVLNALSGNYFVCKYSKQGKAIETPKMVYGEELEEITKQFVVSLEDEQIEFSDYEINLTSEDLLEMSLIKSSKQEIVSESELLPVYLRLSQAEDNLKEKENND